MRKSVPHVPFNIAYWTRGCQRKGDSISLHVDRQNTIIYICVCVCVHFSARRVAAALRESRRSWVSLYRCAMRASIFFGARCASKRSTRVTCFLSWSRGLCLDPEGHGLSIIGVRSAQFFLRRAKRAGLCSAREARRNARLDLRCPLGGSQRLWVGRGGSAWDQTSV